MIQRFTLTVIACVVLLSVAGIRDAQARDTLNVMSFNIRYGTANDGENHWDKRRGMLMELLRRYAPDIIGVQEALRFQLDEIRAALPGYAEVGVGREDGKTSGEYSAILFRTDRLASLEEETFWFSDTPAKPGSMTWGNSYPRICTWTRLVSKHSGQTFYVYNVHLDHVSQPSREKSAAALARKILERGQPGSAVVTGDFNAGESNPAVRFLKAESQLTPETASIRLVDTYRVINPNNAAVGTFHAFSGKSDGDKIDYIFVEPGTAVLDAAILHDNDEGRYPSDHFPVTARIVLSSGRK